MMLTTPKSKALFWIILCKFSFICMMTLVKAHAAYPPLQLNFLRSLIILCFVVPILLIKRPRFHLENLPEQIKRVVCGVLAMSCIFYGYRTLPLAKASAIEFSYGLVLPVMAFLFFRERISLKRWVLLITGYVGIWFILDPTYSPMGIPEIIMLASVALRSCSSVYLKKIATKDPLVITLFYSASATCLFLGFYFILPQLSSPFLPSTLSNWTTLHWQGSQWVLLTAFFSFLSQASYIKAFQAGTLGFLAGFEYLKILFATLIGIAFFSEIPTWSVFMGSSLILAISYFLTRLR